jgi:hypothetical protein
MLLFGQNTVLFVFNSHSRSRTLYSTIWQVNFYFTFENLRVLCKLSVWMSNVWYLCDDYISKCMKSTVHVNVDKYELFSVPCALRVYTIILYQFSTRRRIYRFEHQCDIQRYKHFKFRAFLCLLPGQHRVDSSRSHTQPADWILMGRGGKQPPI